MGSRSGLAMKLNSTKRIKSSVESPREPTLLRDNLRRRGGQHQEVNCGECGMKVPRGGLMQLHRKFYHWKGKMPKFVGTGIQGSNVMLNKRATKVLSHVQNTKILPNYPGIR